LWIYSIILLPSTIKVQQMPQFFSWEESWRKLVFVFTAKPNSF